MQTNIFELSTWSVFLWYEICGYWSIFQLSAKPSWNLHRCICILTHMSFNSEQGMTFANVCVMRPYYMWWCYKLHARCIPPSAHDCVTWTLSIRWPPHSCTFHITLRAALVMLRNIAQSVMLVPHHKTSLLMWFQAHSHCRCCDIALRSSNPKAHYTFVAHNSASWHFWTQRMECFPMVCNLWVLVNFVVSAHVLMKTA